MGFYSDLVAATATERQDLLAIPILVNGAAGQVGLESYLSFLSQAYHHVKHTVPLLMACGARLPERLEWLREAVAEYIEDELGHQEWILNDIRHSGGDAEAVRCGEPHYSTEMMVAYAWDTIQRRNPIGFFGMVLVLEGTSVHLATKGATALQQSLELPAAAFSYLSSHGDLDIKHIGFFEKLMDRVEQTEDQTAIVHCAKMMYRLYGDIFRSLSHSQPTEASA